MLALGAVTAAAEDFWQKKKFSEWTPKEVQKMLKDSPWARPVEIRLDVMSGARMSGGRRRGGGGGSLGDASMGAGSMGGEQGGPGSGGGMAMPESIPTVTAYVRWRTALPVKQAYIRTRFGDEAATSPEAAKLLASRETHYIIEIAGLPPSTMRVNPAQLKAAAQLRIKGKPPIQAVDIKAGREQNLINLYLIFPRGEEGAPAITLEDKEVEVFLRTGPLDIRRKFRLKDMVFEGNLEV